MGERISLKIYKPPRKLEEIGLEDLPITMTQKHLYTIANKSGKYKDVNYHNLGMDLIIGTKVYMYTLFMD